MNRKKLCKRLSAAVLAGTMLCTSVTAPKAATVDISPSKGITTMSSMLPLSTNVKKLSLTVNSSDGQRTYNIFAQRKINDKYVKLHGCAVSSLTTVLSAYSSRYAKYTPVNTYQKLEKKVFGKKAWKRNYNRRRMPVSLNGITKILKRNGIKATYVRKFKNAKAVAQIENHLRQGKPVIIEVDSRRQINGRRVGGYTHKWARSKHTMVLIGMTDTGKVIIADSAQRSWSGQMQRVKYAKMASLVTYMYPCTSNRKTNYYSSKSTSGGYILVD